MHLESFFNYLEFEKRYSAHTRISYQNDLEQFLQFLSRQYDLTLLVEAETMHIRSWVVALLQLGRAPSSIHRKISALKTYYKYLCQRAELKQSPVQGIFLPKKGEKLPSFIEETRMQQLFERNSFVEGWEGLRDYLILDLLYSTGMRRSELIGLSWSAVDWSNHVLRIQGKGNKMRLVPLLPHIETALQEYQKLTQERFPDLEVEEVLLSDKGQVLYPKLVYNKVKEYLSLITTAQKRSPHVLRHSFATHLSNHGANLNAIKDLLGHSSLASTQVYTHTSIENLKKVYEQAHPKAKKK